MDIVSLIHSIAQGEELSEPYLIEQSLLAIKHQPAEVLFPDEQTLEATDLSTLIQSLCALPDFHLLPASGKAIVMALWTRIRHRLCSFSVHAKEAQSLLDLTLVEIVYSHLVKSHLPSSWTRSIASWFALVHRTHEEVLAVALQSIQEYLSLLSAGDVPTLITTANNISPFISLPSINGWTLLHYACSLTDLTYRTREMLQVLLQRGLSTSAIDCSGCTSLHIAAQCLNLSAIQTLAESPKLNKSTRDRRGRTALDTLAITVAKRQTARVVSSDRIIAIVKLLMENNDVSLLWKLWDCDANDDRQERFRESAIFYFITCCEESVGSELLLISSASSLQFTEQEQRIVLCMLIRCITKQKARLVLKLLHFFLKIDRSQERVRERDRQKRREMMSEQSRAEDEREEEERQWSRRLRMMMFYNRLMSVACHCRNAEAQRLLMEIWWPEVLEYFSEKNQETWSFAFFETICQCKEMYRSLFSRFHLYALCSGSEPTTQSELKSLPRRISCAIVVAVGGETVSSMWRENEQAIIDDPQLTEKRQRLRTLIERLESAENIAEWNEADKFGNLSPVPHEEETDSMTSFPLLVWASIVHRESSSARSTSECESSVLDLLQRRLFVVMAGQVEKDEYFSPALCRLLSQSLLWSLVSGNKAALEKWRDFFGPHAFMRWLTTRDVEGVKNPANSLLAVAFSIYADESTNFRVLHRNSSSSDELSTSRRVNLLQLTKDWIQGNLFSFVDWSQHSLCVEASPIAHGKRRSEEDMNLIRRDFHSIRAWLASRFLFLVNGDRVQCENEDETFPSLSARIVEWMSIQMTRRAPSLTHSLCSYHLERQSRWESIKFSMFNVSDPLFRTGLRKIGKGFTPDDKWIKLAFYCSTLHDWLLLMDSDVFSPFAANTATPAVPATLDKSHWDRFVRTLSSPLKSQKQLMRFLRRLCGLSVIPTGILSALSLQCSTERRESPTEGEEEREKRRICWERVLTDDRVASAWRQWKESYQASASLRVVMHRKNVMIGRRSAFDVDTEAERKRDRAVHKVFDTLSALCETIFFDGTTFERELYSGEEKEKETTIQVSLGEAELSESECGRELLAQLSSRSPSDSALSSSSNYSLSSLSWSISRRDFFDTLCLLKMYDRLELYSLSRPSDCFSPNDITVCSLLSFPLSVRELELVKATELVQREQSRLDRILSLWDWRDSVRSDKDSQSVSTSSSRTILTQKMKEKEKYLVKDFSQCLTLLAEHSEKLSLSLSPSLCVSQTEQTVFVFELCVRGCYDVAQSILSRYEEKAHDARIAVAPSPLHCFYHYTCREAEESLSEMMLRFRTRFLNKELTTTGDKPVTVEHRHGHGHVNTKIERESLFSPYQVSVYQLTPLHFALLDNQRDFISLFLRCFPWFPLDFEQLLLFCEELGLHEECVSLFAATAHGYRTDDFGPFGLVSSAWECAMSCIVQGEKSEKNEKATENMRERIRQQEMQKWLRDVRRRRERSLSLTHLPHSLTQRERGDRRAEAICEDIYRVIAEEETSLHTHYCGRRTKRRSYAFNDPRLLYDFVVWHNTQKNAVAADGSALSLQLMDGTVVSLSAVQRNVSLLLRALPTPTLTRGFCTRSFSSPSCPNSSSSSLLHLLLRHACVDAVRAIVKENSLWLRRLEERDAHGESAVSLCLSHGQYDLLRELFSQREHLSPAHTLTQQYVPKYSILEHVRAFAVQRLSHLRHANVTLPTTQHSAEAIQATQSTFAAHAHAIPHDTLLQRLALSLQYTERFYRYTLLPRDFLTFVQFSLSSTVFSKMDSIVRARQILTIIALPYSLLTPTVQRVEKGKESERESLFVFEPRALLRKISAAQYAQLKHLVSGWHRSREQYAIEKRRGRVLETTLKEREKSNSSSCASVIKDCLFTFHADKKSCASLALSVDDCLTVSPSSEEILFHRATVRTERAKARYITSSTTVSNALASASSAQWISSSLPSERSHTHRHTTPSVSSHGSIPLPPTPLRRETVEELLRVELLSNRENALLGHFDTTTPSHLGSGTNGDILVQSGGSVCRVSERDALSLREALESAAVILEFARWLCVCRALSVATFEVSGEREDREAASSSSVSRFASHPLHRQHQETTHFAAQVSLLDALSAKEGESTSGTNTDKKRETVLRGLRSRLRIADSLSAAELRVFLLANPAMSVRVSLLRDFLCEGLTALLLDCEQFALCELVNRILVERNTEDSTHKDEENKENEHNEEESKVIKTDNPKQKEKIVNKTAQHSYSAPRKGSRLSDDLRSLQLVVDFLRSFSLRDLWLSAHTTTRSSSKKKHPFKNFLDSFRQATVRVLLSQESDGGRIVELIKTLKSGTMLEMSREEETHIENLLSSVSSSRLTAFRREKMQHELCEQVRVSLKVLSELFWLLSSIFGLLSHSSPSPSSIDLVTKDYFSFPYNSFLFAEDEAIAVSQSKEISLHCLATPRSSLALALPAEHSLSVKERTQTQSVYRDAIERVFFFQQSTQVEHTSPTETVLRVLQQAALCGNLPLLETVCTTSTMRVLLATPTLRERVKFLVFYTLCVCPTLSAMTDATQPLTETQITTEIAHKERRRDYERVLLWLLEHRLPVDSPMNLSSVSFSHRGRKGHGQRDFSESEATRDNPLHTFDLALLKQLPWEIVSKILNSLPLHTNSNVQVISPFTACLLALCTHIARTHPLPQMRNVVSINARDALRSVFLSCASSAEKMHAEEKKFSFTSALLAERNENQSRKESSGGDMLTDNNLSRIALSVEEYVQAISGQDEEDRIFRLCLHKNCLEGAEENDNSPLATHMLAEQVAQSVRFSLGVVFSEKLSPCAHSKVFQSSPSLLRSISPFARDFLSFTDATHQSWLSLSAVDDSQNRWSLLHLAMLSGESLLLEKALVQMSFDAKLSSLLNGNEGEINKEETDDFREVCIERWISMMKELVLVAVHNNDAASLKVLRKALSPADNSERGEIGIWEMVINTPFTVMDREGNSESFSLINLVAEQHDRLSVLSFLLRERLDVSSQSIASLLCLGLAREDALYLIVKTFIATNKERDVNQWEEERESLQKMTTAYDECAGRELLADDNTLFHVICRRGFVSLATLWISDILCLTRMPWYPLSHFVLTGIIRVESAEPEFSAITDTLNSQRESPLSISIAQGCKTLTRLLGAHCPARIHDAVRKIVFVFRLFALNRAHWKEKFSAQQEQGMVEMADNIEEDDDDYDYYN